VSVDYRPHCNLERVNALLRDSKDDIASLAIGGDRVAACGNRWGDGLFEVIRSRAATGEVVKVEVVLGDERRKNLMRRVLLRAKTAIITRPVFEGQPIEFAERMTPTSAQHSGWLFSAGTETSIQMESPEFFELVTLDFVFKAAPEFEALASAPVGTTLRREGKTFVPD
jgi:hypothetical protein